MKKLLIGTFLTFLLLLTGCSSNVSDDYVVLGNSNGNMAHSGIFCTATDSIAFTDSSRYFTEFAPIEVTEESRFRVREAGFSFNADDENYYFIGLTDEGIEPAGNLRRVLTIQSKDGKEKESIELAPLPSAIALINDSIYVASHNFISGNELGNVELYKYSKNGNKQLIWSFDQNVFEEYEFPYINATSSHLYVILQKSGKMYQLDYSGKNSKLIASGNLKRPIIEQDKVYYISQGAPYPNDTLIEQDAEKKVTVIDDMVSDYNIVNGKVIYLKEVEGQYGDDSISDMERKYELYRYDIEAGVKERVNDLLYPKCNVFSGNDATILLSLVTHKIQDVLIEESSKEDSSTLN